MSLHTKYVTLIGNRYANFEGISSMGNETTYRLGADLYIHQALSAGGSIADFTANESDTLLVFTVHSVFNICR
ncbi:hypothetical protein [Acinetobacter sp.]|uniref:hypothetical protein n=1 Tax=Acinetobacter sp. TaxID=472 RepID=UPI00388DCD2C